MFDDEHVGVEVGNNLFALLCQIQVVQSILDVRKDPIPVELRIVSPQIPRILVS
jgi:hypothetical protein